MDTLKQFQGAMKNEINRVFDEFCKQSDEVVDGMQNITLHEGETLEQARLRMKMLVVQVTQDSLIGVFLEQMAAVQNAANTVKPVGGIVIPGQF